MEPQIKPCFVHLVRLAATAPKKTSTKIVVKQPALKKRVQCPVCPQTCKTPSHLEIHFRVHTNERPFGCEVCNKKFKTQSEVKVHLKVHSDERPYSCIWCDKCFKIKDALMKHIRVHTKEKPFFCQKCPTTFSTLIGLSRHENGYHDLKNGKRCEFCSKTFYSTSGLQVHLRVHTSEKPFSCSVCGSSFALKGDLTRHSRIHSGSKPFSCKKCKKQFRTSDNLKRHIRGVHSNIRPYKCKICENAYLTRSNRDRHTNSHFNEKHHRCDLCGKRFAHRHTLLYHQKSYHDKIRRFKCSECSKSFVDPGSLKLHFMRRHCNPTERPFHCLFCTKTFSDQRQLDNHVRSHLSEKPYSCDTCDFSSGYKGSLKTHIFRFHSLS